MNSVAYDRVSVTYNDGFTLDGVADIKRIDISKYSAEDEARWRRITRRFRGSPSTFQPHYFVIARTAHGGTHPTMLQLMPLGNNLFRTIPFGRTRDFDELEAETIRLLTSKEFANFATLQPAGTNLSVGLFLKL